MPSVLPYVLLLYFCAADLVRAGTLVQFRTPLGDLPVELFDDNKPVTVDNFLRLTLAGRYQNTFMQRCATNFVLQGGGYRVTTPASTQLITTVFAVSHFGAITNEFLAGRVISNTFGTIAMAKVSGQPNSATCHWFFNLNDNSANLNNQNGGFTVFGRLLGDTNMLNSFNARSPGNGLVNAGATFPTLPVLYSGTNDPRYADLIYVDITPLQVAVSNAPVGGSAISWLSVSNWTHVVEYTDEFPPAWQELIRTNGNGERLTVSDPNESPGRFYRVRVEHP